MLIFEYTRRREIDPLSLINDAPSLWRWTNPDIGPVVSWLFDVYGVVTEVDSTALMSITSARVDATILSTVYTYADCVVTPSSFYWDNEAQIAYFNLPQHPFTYTTMDLSALYGASFGRAVVFNGILYPNILLTKPSITSSVEPVVNEKMATQAINVELINDSRWALDADNKPYMYYRFDNTKDLNGQTTYYRYGDDDDAYEDLIILHKGIITNIEKSGTRLHISCDDVRTKKDVEWPTLTFAGAGYTEEQIGEDMLSKIIPDGFGYNENMEMFCVNRDEVIIPVNDDDELDLTDVTNLVPWDVSTWTASNCIVKKRDSDMIAKFDSYRIAKTTTDVANGVTHTFIATGARMKLSGYVRADEVNVPSGNTVVKLTTVAGTVRAYVSLDISGQSFTSAGTLNTRVKYNIADDGKVTAYFSFEYSMFDVGIVHKATIAIDDTLTNESALVVAGIRVAIPSYPQFRVSNKFSDTTELKVYYEKDDEMIEVTNIVDTDIATGVVTIHEVDAHEDGIITNGVHNLYCSANLRAEVNPMDIIKVLNEEASAITYIDSFYDKATCEAEQVKLADVCMYVDSKTKLTTLIEELQNGSTVGFRYDDVDKIYIMCDDPNRAIARVIQFEEITNRAELSLDSDLTLYADEVTINYGVDRKSSAPLKDRNTDYQRAVLLKYSYTNPLTQPSLLRSQTDAHNKGIILLEDLSIVRDVTSISVEGLQILREVGLLSMVMVNLSLSKTRNFAGWQRMQVIGMEVDTDFGFVLLELRQRVYSDAFAEITGSYEETLVLGDRETEIVVGNVDEVIGAI